MQYENNQENILFPLISLISSRLATTLHTQHTRYQHILLCMQVSCAATSLNTSVKKILHPSNVWEIFHLWIRNTDVMFLEINTHGITCGFQINSFRWPSSPPYLLVIHNLRWWALGKVFSPAEPPPKCFRFRGIYFSQSDIMSLFNTVFTRLNMPRYSVGKMQTLCSGIPKTCLLWNLIFLIHQIFKSIWRISKIHVHSPVRVIWCE